MSNKPNIPVKSSGDTFSAEELNTIVNFFENKPDAEELIPGPEGPQGIQGIQGPEGPKGVDGQSAYSIAVENGYVGTEEEWIESLSPVRYMDGDIFDGDGETPETKTTIKDGSIGEEKLSEEVRGMLNGEGDHPESGTKYFSHFLAEAPPTHRVNGTGSYVLLNFNYPNPQHLGVITLSTGTTSSGYAQILETSGGSLKILTLGQHKVNLELRASCSHLSSSENEYEIRLGFETNNFGSITDGIFFRYNHNENGGNIQCVCKKSSIESFVDTGILFNHAKWYIFRIEILYSSEVLFYIDNNLVGSLSSNIPDMFGHSLGIRKKTGINERFLFIDWLKIIVQPLNSLTTP